MDIDNDDDISTNRYAFLVAKSNDSDVIIDKEAKVLVSFLDGVVLLQTDKPIYTPKQSGSLEYTRGNSENISYTQIVHLKLDCSSKKSPAVISSTKRISFLQFKLILAH